MLSLLNRQQIPLLDDALAIRTRTRFMANSPESRKA